MYDVACIACPDYEADRVRTALLQAIGETGTRELFAPGRTVVIKANLVSAKKPETATTTHPVLLAELTRLLKEFGCDVVVGDSPGGLYTAAHLNQVYKETGLNCITDCGGELNKDFSHKAAHFEEARVCKDFEYTSYLDRADVLINFCKLKTHGMMGMSCAVKNLFGTIPGVFKPEYHYRFPRYEDFADMLVDLNCFFKPALVLCDAIEGMEGNGPTCGTPRHIGALLASTSPYALDVVAAELIGLEPSDIPTVEAAAKRGLGVRKASELSVSGDPEALKVPDYNNIVTRRSLSFGVSGDSASLFGRLAAACLESKPKVRASMCIACGKCAQTCPAKAIEIKKGRPVFDRSKCIRCFCCQEFCPKGALYVARPLAARIVNHK